MIQVINCRDGVCREILLEESSEIISREVFGNAMLDEDDINKAFDIMIKE